MRSLQGIEGKLKSCVSRFTRPVFLAGSLVMLSLSILFLTEVLGLKSNATHVSRESRKVAVEALAVHLSSLASKGTLNDIQATLSGFVLRNDDIHAASLVRNSGVVLAELGDNTLFEKTIRGSTSTQLYVPIYNQSQLWGEVRVAFSPVSNLLDELKSYAFIALSFLFVFTVFLNRALVQLDPKGAVPNRVDSAMNLFSAGVLILDSKLRIVMANDSAAFIAQRHVEDLSGHVLDDWAWKKQEGWQAPWATTLHSGLAISDQRLVLITDDGSEQCFLVSCAFVGEDDRRGVLVTLDDMTTVEAQNQELTRMVSKLRKSQDVINEKNRELKLLATTDPLTGIFNRRVLMETLDKCIERSLQDGSPLACIMTDIDKFKQVNDNFGHAVGDDVIRATATAMQSVCRENDILGRYGGEEFVIVLPGLDLYAAAEVAERARIAVMALAYGDQLAVPTLSSSFGVSDLTCGATDSVELVDAADQCLYLAKQAGRNRVMTRNSDASPSLEKDKASGSNVNTSPPDITNKLVEKSALDHSKLRVLELEKALLQRDQELSKIREFDSLTGMPLRSVFLQRTDAELVRATRDSNLVGVISFKLRDLERLVSTLGYVLSDELVVAVADRLQNGLRTTDVVSMLSTEHSLSRISSNEYGLLLSSLSDTTSAMIVVTRLKRLLSDPFLMDGEKVYVGAAIGVAISSQEKQHQAAELFAEASEACQQALVKSDKISHVFASNSLNAESNDYIRLESDLHDALDNHEIEIWFQPKFDLAIHRIVGMEALVRWKHETDGFIPPDLFVTVAEANDLIDKLSDYVLHKTLKQIVVWRSMGFDDLKISVNISPMQLCAETFVSDILNALNKAGVDGKQLEIELTETSVLKNPQQARIALATLRENGVGISIDDFGAGYTSLSLLAELPLDVVKIDRLFIKAVESSARSRAVVGSVISMAHALNLRVVGEGVESNEQLEIMSRLGCDEIQGYLISRPKPADEMTEFLVHQRNSEQARRA